MTAQEQRDRVDAAVRRAAMSVIGRPIPEQLAAIMREGFAAILAEVGPQPEDGARDETPPVHELPTELGAVVLITGYGGEPVVPPRPAMRQNGMTFLSSGLYDNEPVSWSCAETDITDWLPARVVRDDGADADFDDAVAALRRILADVERTDIGCYTTLKGVAFTAREALKRLDGES